MADDLTILAASSAGAKMAAMDLATLNRLERTDQHARDFTRLIFAHGLAAIANLPLEDVVAQYPGMERLRQKAAVLGGTTTTLGPLAGDITTREFLTLVSRGTVLGRLIGAVPAPPNVQIPTPSTDPVAYWVRGGYPMPLALMSFSDPRTAIAKYGVLMAFSRELFRVADDRALTVIERVTMRALRRGEDTLLLSADAAVADGSPAGLLNGLTAVGAGSPASIADVEQLWSEVSDGDPMNPVFIVSPRGAMHLAALNVAGEPIFPNISPATGGDIAGVPVLLSKPAGNKLILIDAAMLAVTDEGLQVGRSEQAAVQMLDDPTNNAATATATNVVSAFQSNAVIMRFVRFLHWTKLTTDAVAYIELPIGGSPA